MEYLPAISVPAIATIVYWVVNLFKYTFDNSEKFKRFIPLLSATLGAVLGIVFYYIAPEILISPNIVVAFIVGGSSGLTATGTHQIIKQLAKNGKNQNNNKKP